MQGKFTVTLIAGDGAFEAMTFEPFRCSFPIIGIGPEISESVKDIYAAAEVRSYPL